MMHRMCLFLSLLLCYEIGYAKVLIITHSYNRPDFIEIQSKCFKKFMQDEYEFVVFSDAKEESMNEEIKQACLKSQARYIRIPQEIHRMPYLPRQAGDPLDRPNIRHVNVVQYSMDVLGFDHEGPVVVLDSDMFLVRPTSIVEYMKDCDIRALIRGADNNVTYLCPILMMFSMDRLPEKKTMNFNCGRADGASVDSGGYTHYYLKKHSNLKVMPVVELFSYQLFGPDRFAVKEADNNTPVEQQITTLQSMGFNQKEITFLQRKPHTISFILDNSFLHYRAGSNYDNQSKLYDQQKMILINEFLEVILA